MVRALCWNVHLLAQGHSSHHLHLRAPPPARQEGVLSQKAESRGMQEMMMTNPDFMQNMMKQQLGGLLPQVRRAGLLSAAAQLQPPL
jgi:hypothetical protein